MNCRSKCKCLSCTQILRIITHQLPIHHRKKIIIVRIKAKLVVLNADCKTNLTSISYTQNRRRIITQQVSIRQRLISVRIIIKIVFLNELQTQLYTFPIYQLLRIINQVTIRQGIITVRIIGKIVCLDQGHNNHFISHVQILC